MQLIVPSNLFNYNKLYYNKVDINVLTNSLQTTLFSKMSLKGERPREEVPQTLNSLSSPDGFEVVVRTSSVCADRYWKGQIIFAYYELKTCQKVKFAITSKPCVVRRF